MTSKDETQLQEILDKIQDLVVEEKRWDGRAARKAARSIDDLIQHYGRSIATLVELRDLLAAKHKVVTGRDIGRLL